MSCCIVSVLVLLDVTDTDKPGIYSTLYFFSLLLSLKVNQGACQPVCSNILKAFGETLPNVANWKDCRDLSLLVCYTKQLCLLVRGSCCSTSPV